MAHMISLWRVAGRFVLLLIRFIIFSIIINIMIDVENSTECVICYEHTMNKTICSHIICKNCMKRLEKCAVCRKDFFVSSQEAIDDLNRRIRYINTIMICCSFVVLLGLVIILTIIIFNFV